MTDLSTSIEIAYAHLRAAYLAMAPHNDKGSWIGSLKPLMDATRELGFDPATLTPRAEDVRVWWYLDLPRDDDPRGIAQKALEIMQDPDSTATIFEIELPAGGVERVDLLPEEEETADPTFPDSSRPT